MKRILLLGCILFLLCGYAYSQQRVPQYYPGVLINGVYWSEYNLNAPETFTATSEESGMRFMEFHHHISTQCRKSSRGYYRARLGGFQ